LPFKSNDIAVARFLGGTRKLPTFSPRLKHKNINKYQQARTTKASRLRRAGLSKPLRKTPKLGNSQAARLASIAAIETTEGLRIVLGRKDIIIFVGSPRVEM
jgi:hypothetical protein